MNSLKSEDLQLSNKASVSVIVVNYNAGDLLLACARSSLDQATELIVVDNASTDHSLDHLEDEIKSSALKIIRSDKNLGFAAACNMGAAAATNDYILFLNPDCEMNPGSLNRLVEVLKNNPVSGMVGGLLINPNGGEQGGGRRAVPTPWRSFVRAFGLSRWSDRWPSLFFDFNLHKQPLPKQPIEVEAISGALMLVRREAMNQVGLWDEKYFLHCEDLDWCMRFRQKGWKILFVPDAPVVHHQGACSRTRPIFVEWHKHKGMNRFYNKFFRHQYPGFLMWLVAIGVWFRFATVAVYYLSKQLKNFLIRETVAANPEKLKVLVVSQYFWPESFLVNGLVSELQKKGHHVEVLTGLPNYPQGYFNEGYSFWRGPWTEIYKGATVYRVPLLARGNNLLSLSLNYISFVFFASIFGVFRIKRKPDVIFCFSLSPVTSCIPGIILKWFLRRPLTIWVQDLWPDSIEAVGVTQSKTLLSLVGLVVRFIYSACDQILIQSEAFRKSVLQQGGKPNIIHYVPNWAPELLTQKNNPDWLSRLPSGFKVIFAGNIGKAQDIPTHLAAASFIKNSFPEIKDIRWVFVGDGSELDFLKKEIKSRGLENIVFTFGHKPLEDMPYLYQSADGLLVSLSAKPIFALTVPSKIQSYMASGKPILASIDGEGARIIEESKSGLSVSAENPKQLADAILKLYSMSAGDREKMGTNGKAYFASHFNQDLVIGKLLDNFKEIVKQN